MEKVNKDDKEKEDNVEDEASYLQDLVESFSKVKTKKKKEEGPKEKYAFWDSQPVPKIQSNVEETGPIENKTLDEVRKEPYNLPKNYSWYDLDINDPKDLKKVRYF